MTNYACSSNDKIYKLNIYLYKRLYETYIIKTDHNIVRYILIVIRTIDRTFSYQNYT